MTESMHLKKYALTLGYDKYGLTLPTKGDNETFAECYKNAEKRLANLREDQKKLIRSNRESSNAKVKGEMNSIKTGLENNNKNHYRRAVTAIMEHGITLGLSRDKIDAAENCENGAVKGDVVARNTISEIFSDCYKLFLLQTPSMDMTLEEIKDEISVLELYLRDYKEDYRSKN